MINKKFSTLMIFLLLTITCFAVGNIDSHYYDLALPMNQEEGVWFDEAFTQNPNTFWFDSSGSYSDFQSNTSTFKYTSYANGEYGTDISAVDWYTNIRQNYTDTSYSYMTNMQVAYSFDGTSDTQLKDPEIIVIRPTTIDILKWSDTYNSLTLDSTVSSTFNGWADTGTTEGDQQLYNRINHLGMIDFNDDGAVDLVTLEESGTDTFMQGYYYNSGILADNNYRLNVTHMRLNENTTGNIDCYANAGMNGSIKDICVIINNYCELFVVEATTTDFTELFEIDFSDSCNATGGSNTTGTSGVISNKIVDDLFLTDGENQEWIMFMYMRSNATDRDVIEIVRELQPNGEQLDNFLFDSGSGGNAWEQNAEFAVKKEFMGTTLGEQVLVKEWGIGSVSGHDITLTKYTYSGGVYTGTDIHSDDTRGYGRTSIFFPNSAVVGGKSLCYAYSGGYSCVDGNGAETTSTNTDFYDYFGASDPALIVNQIYDTQGLENYKTLYITDTNIAEVDFGINGGIGITKTFSQLTSDNALHISDSGNQLLAFIDDDQYPDLIEFDRDSLAIRVTVSGFTNFPPVISVTESWNTSETCNYPTNYSDQSGEFCWSLTCTDSENDYVGLWVDWGEGSGYERYTEAGSFRCNTGLTGADAVCHAYNDSGNYTPSFMVNQTAVYPSNTDTVNSTNTLTISTAEWCTLVTGLTTTTTISTNLDLTKTDGSLSSTIDDLLEAINITDSSSKFILAMLLMIAGMIFVGVIGYNNGMEGSGLVSMSLAVGVLMFVLFSFMGLIPIGIMITIIVLAMLFVGFKFINNGE